MLFDIEEHVKDHFYGMINNLDHKVSLHFNTSADIAYFILAGFVTQNAVNEIMNKIINNISEKVIYAYEKNGIDINKGGQEKQKFRTRKIVFDNILLAYHDKHFDASKSVSPHIHVLGHKTSRLGINFMYLKQAIEEEADKYNVKFNFMEQRKETGLGSYKLKNLKSMNWLFQKGNLSEIHNFITNNESAFNRNMDSLLTHYRHTYNLSFFLKTLLIVNQRLDELNLDYMYCNTNLKENIFFFLLPSDIERVELLKEGNTIKINIDNVFDREILKYAYGFETEVMGIVADKFNIRTIHKEQLDIEEKIISNDVVKNDFIGFRDLVIMDIRNAISIAKNEKELKSIIVDMKYEKIFIRTSKLETGKRKKIGFNIVTEKKTKMFIPFSQLRISWLKIVMLFSHNKKKNKKNTKLKSNLDKYEKKNKKIDMELIKFKYKVPKLLELYCPDYSDHIKIEKFSDYDIQRSEMYEITTMKNQHSTIVVTNNRIILKKTSGGKRIIQDIKDIAKLIGWEMNDITVMGNDEFVEKIKFINLAEIKKVEDVFTGINEEEIVIPKR